MSFAFPKECLTNNVTVYPSGKKVANGKETKSKYSYRGLALKAVTVALCGATVFGGGLGIKKLHDRHDVGRLSDVEKTTLTTEYDASLLSKIDSLYNTGMSMEKAVENGVNMQTSRTEGTSIFSKAEDVVIANHAKLRQNESRDINHIEERTEKFVGMVNGHAQVMFKHVSDTTYAYKADFRDHLAEELKTQQNGTQQQSSAETTTQASVSAAVIAAKLSNSR